jgi:hypothetical protein
MNNGHRIIAAHVGLLYLMPLIGHWLVPDAPSPYKQYDPSMMTLLQLAAIYGLFAVLDAAHFRLFPAMGTAGLVAVVAKVSDVYQRVRLFIAMAAVLFGIAGMIWGLNSYRYSAEGISELPVLERVVIIALMILNLVLTVDMFYWMFVAPVERTRVFSRRYWEHLFISIGFVVITNGIFSLMQAVMALFFTLRPELFHQLLFAPRDATWAKVLFRTTASAAVLVIAMSLSWYFGSIVKLSTSRSTADLFNETDRLSIAGITDQGSVSRSIGLYLLERTSIFYYSYVFTIEAPESERPYSALEVLEIPIQTFLFRVDFLMGRMFDVQKPDPGAVSRMNYQLLTAGDIRAREGSAPGIFASANYVFPFPFNMIVSALYLVWISRTINTLLQNHSTERLSLFGVLVLPVLFPTVFFSPLDFLTVFDEGFLYLLMMAPLVVWQRANRPQPALMRPRPSSPVRMALHSAPRVQRIIPSRGSIRG